MNEGKYIGGWLDCCVDWLGPRALFVVAAMIVGGGAAAFWWVS